MRLRNGLRDLDAFAAAVRRCPVVATPTSTPTPTPSGPCASWSGPSHRGRGPARVRGPGRPDRPVRGRPEHRPPGPAGRRPTTRRCGPGHDLRAVVAAVLLRGALLGVGGALLATATAVLLSPLTPIGLARRAEVDRGLPSTGPSRPRLGRLLAVRLARTALAGWAATRASGAAQGGRSAVRRRRPGPATACRRRRPAERGHGTRLAFESGQGAAALPARTAAVGPWSRSRPSPPR